MRAPFVISIRHFLWLASVLLFLAFLIVCIVCLSSISGIAHLSSEVRNKNLPTLVDNQRALLAVEKLRLNAEIVNLADDHETRRQARMRAESMRLDSSFVPGSDYEQMGSALINMIMEMASYRDSSQMSKLRMQALALEYSAALVEMAARIADKTAMDTVFKAYRETSIARAGTEGISARSIALAERLKMSDETNTDFIHAECERYARNDPDLGPVCARQSGLYTSYAQIQELQNDNFAAISNLWQQIDALLQGMQGIVTGDAEYLITRSLTSIETASGEAVYTTLFMLLGGAVFYVSHHFIVFWFIVRPLRWTGRKLRDLQRGELQTPPLPIWVEELLDVAVLLDRFGVHISDLNSHASLMAEDAAERQEVMMSVFRISVDGYDIWCPDGEYFANDELLHILGLSDVEEVRLYWDEMRFASGEQLMETLEEVGEAGFARGEITLRSLAGERIPFEVTRLPVRRRGLKCVLSYYRDLREQKRIEKELRQARDEAREASQIKSEFLARMSHELRTPMNGILGMTHLALSETPPASIASFLNKIKDSARILLCLISDILDFSTMDSGRFSLQCAEFSYPRMLETVEDLFRRQAGEKKLHCTVETDPRVPDRLFGDAPRLSQILLHLCANAVKFTSHGTVSLKCALLEDLHDSVRLSFAVADSGIGMSAEQTARLFKPFTQADSSSTRPYDGAGLGLVIVRFLVEKMDGTLEIQTEPGKGTTVFFTALLHKPSGRNGKLAGGAALPGNGATASGTPDSGRSVLQGAKVLLVEDNPVNQEIARALLETLGLHVFTAENGAEAVSLLEHEYADCVLMDIQMPVMDGHAAARAIRGQGRDAVRGVPIIAMTADVTEGNRADCFASGMDDFATKPIDVAQVRAKLEHWIGRRQ